MRTLLDVAAYLELDDCRLVLLGANPTVHRIIGICQEPGRRSVDVFPCPT
jgi:hypothetical protein